LSSLRAVGEAIWIASVVPPSQRRLRSIYYMQKPFQNGSVFSMELQRYKKKLILM